MNKDKIIAIAEFLDKQADKLYKSKNKKKMHHNFAKADYYMQVSFFLIAYANNQKDNAQRNYDNFDKSTLFDITQEFPELKEIIQPYFEKKYSLKMTS